MALIDCFECGNEVSDSAKTCPKCGAKVTKPVKHVSPIVSLVVIVSFVAFIALVSQAGKEKTGVSPEQQSLNAKSQAEAARAAEAQAAERKEAERKRLAALTPAQRAAEEKAAQAKAAAAAKAVAVAKAAYAKAAAKEAAAQAREKKQNFGEPPVSNSRYRNSYAVVELYVERAMGDPESLKMGDCTEVRRETAGWVVGCSYRGKNALGGMVREFKWFIIRNNRVILTADESTYRR